ncbi:2-hydroxychromene-2-carboxylate isomerase [Sulfitobacter mediterraneus]|uniref:2-hydroxychromene-2-carboxylate isomerase n=1 Tax=Sulfitobacter mediterraneus TaxID=83219 RepID=UPI000EA246DF|nr:2-hydroxychromene-2-carboxylate isomerase [Sulfitobacter mediterraneus]UWR10428.1 2-hydroxychromene-2-carboxylate isomerase [Sulfitobacter mediterraneus]
MPATPIIEYFYSAHSAYAYLGAWELERIAKAAGAQVQHRPFDFMPVMDAAGGRRFKDRTQAHVDYFFGREMVRWAEWRGLPMIRHRPTFHDNPLHLANGMIIASGADAAALSQAILQAHWRDDADIADRATLNAIAQAVELDGSALLLAAETDAVQTQHNANTQEAIARNVFGSPTYFVGGDMFYGQDRLDMVARALDKPFAA